MALSTDGTGAEGSTTSWLDGAWVRRARSFDGGSKAERSNVVWLQVGPWFADFRHPFPGRQASHSLDIAHAFSGTIEAVDSADGHATVTWWHDLDTEDRSELPDTARVTLTGGELVEAGAGYVEWWSRPDTWGQEWSGLVLEQVSPETSTGASGESVTARVVCIGPMAVAVWAGPEAGGACWESEAGREPSRLVGAAALRADIGAALRTGLGAAPLPDGVADPVGPMNGRGGRASGVRRVVLLTLGWEDLPKSVSVHGAPPGERLRGPVPGVLLQCDGGWLLLDTGFNPALIRDPALRRRFHGDPGFRPILPGPGEPLEEALADAGIAMEEIASVAVSHLHNDHAGGLRHFAGRVPVHAQRAEVVFGLSDHPVPEQHAIFRIDFDDPSIDWRLADGDTDIAPGVTAVLTSGHTPGHQSFMVELDESVGGGGLIFAFDAADLTENIEDELAIGGRVGVPPEATIEPIRRLKALAAERHYQLVPGHDPVVWPALTRTLAERFAVG